MSEYLEFGEQVQGMQTEGIAMPLSHTEGLAYSEGMTVTDTARQVYNSEEMFGLGLRQEWERLTPGEDGEGAFTQSYAAYVLHPESLREAHPERYDFIKEHVFYGHEFSSPQAQEQTSAPKFGYLDYDTQGRQIEVTANGKWVVGTGERIE